MMKKPFRPPAVPLLTVDPYFSVWSMADRLFDSDPCHWSGIPNALNLMLRIDGVPWRVMGLLKPDLRNSRNCNTQQPMGMEQRVLEVRPLTTHYEFYAAGVRLTLDFRTPFLPDDRQATMRPVSYVEWTVAAEDGRKHRVELYFDVSAELCVNDGTEAVNGRRENIGGRAALSFGNREQRPLWRSGDDVRIDWGRIWLSAPAESRAVIGTAELRQRFATGEDLPVADELPGMDAVSRRLPVMACYQDFGLVDGRERKSFSVIAYDDVLAIEYFGARLVAAWRREEPDFRRMLEAATAEYEGLAASCDRLDAELIAEAEAIGGEKYAAICALAWRQAFAAHKMVYDENGELLFFSKENFSGGFIGTVDVSYPSMPLFLRFCPELVRGMMRPIFRYASRPAWQYEFAPHDVGRYPLANGQLYGDNQLEYQMPVEECGNMLLMAGAVVRAEPDTTFTAEEWRLLRRWATYLSRTGLELERQLCTDDFAGHLAGNANLAIKGILGIGAFAQLCEKRGLHEEAATFLNRARELAAEWLVRAAVNGHTVLAFGAADSWSLKYNLVWDRLLGLNLFPEELAAAEVRSYLGRILRYGVPLDNRKPYTKADWVVWAASLARERIDFEHLIAPLYRFLDETPSRIPFGDWYGVTDGLEQGFRARSVVGGVFLPFLSREGGGFGA